MVREVASGQFFFEFWGEVEMRDVPARVPRARVDLNRIPDTEGVQLEFVVSGTGAFVERPELEWEGLVPALTADQKIIYVGADGDCLRPRWRQKGDTPMVELSKEIKPKEKRRKAVVSPFKEAMEYMRVLRDIAYQVGDHWIESQNGAVKIVQVEGGWTMESMVGEPGGVVVSSQWLSRVRVPEMSRKGWACYYAILAGERDKLKTIMAKEAPPESEYVTRVDTRNVPGPWVHLDGAVDREAIGRMVKAAREILDSKRD